MIAALWLLMLPSAVPDFATLSAQADAARKANNPAAVELYRRALRLNPSWKEGWWSLGSIYYQQDNYSDCGDAFEKAAGLEPKAGAPWTMVGLCEFGAKRFDRAFEHLKKGQELGVPVESIDSVAKFQFAKLLVKRGNFEQALGLLITIAQTGKTGAAYLNVAGLAALWKPVFVEEIAPADRELVFLAGKALWDIGMKHAADARQSFDVLLSKYPSSPGVNYFHGTYELADDPDRAITDFEQELKISPQHVGALMALAAEYLRRGEVDKGLPYARRSVELYPDSFASHAMLGRLLAASGDSDEALRELETARRLGPEQPETRIALASLYAKLGREEDAARERREFLRLKNSGREGSQQ
jgi:tetratricopeptide (TPR) repeat protein